MADQYHIDQTRISVLGFSSGGYVLGLVTARSDYRSYLAVDAMDAQSARPNFAVLIYPVVTLDKPSDGTATARKTVDAHASHEAREAWSADGDVHADDPPMFIVQASATPS